MNQNNNALIIAILVGCFSIAAAIIFYAATISKGNTTDNQVAQAPVVQEVSTDDDAVLGDKNAPVTIVEFSDYNCGYCKRHFNETLPLIKEKYIDTGKVKLVFRDAAFFGESSIQLANAASCAQKFGGDEAYYELHGQIYSGNKDLEALIAYGKSIGLPEDEFNNCVKNNENLNEVLKDTQDAKSYGVKGTPGFFVNGENISGAMPFSEFERIIEKQLNS